MASNAEDLLSCPICFEHFQDPRLLHCGHTFCKTCLTEYHNKDPRGFQNHILCPTCRTPTQLNNQQIDSLPKDFRIGQFQDVISQSEDKKKTKQTLCVLCRERNATTEASRLCTDCKRDFCEPCSVRHSNVPAFKTHRIISMPTGDMATLIHCGAHNDELLMYNCATCDQFVCSLCITDTHNTCDVHSITESLEQNHKKLKAVLTPLLANEDTLNSHLRDYNITIEKLNEAHDAIDRQANLLHEQIKKARNKLQRELATYEQEQVAKLLTSLSDDGSVDVHSYKQLCSDIQNLAGRNDPWTAAMQTSDLVTKATNVNQSLDRLKEAKSGRQLQCMTFTTSSDTVELGTLDLTTIEDQERENYPGYTGKTSTFPSTSRQSSQATASNQSETAALPKPSTSEQAFPPEQHNSYTAGYNQGYSAEVFQPGPPNQMNKQSTGCVAPERTCPPGPGYSNSYWPTPPPPYTSAHLTPAFNHNMLGTKRCHSESSAFQPAVKMKADLMNQSASPLMRERELTPRMSGITVSGLPPGADKQSILELFGFDVVKHIVVKDDLRSGWFGTKGRVAWILYQNPFMAGMAVQQFNQKLVLGAVVHVQLCDEKLVQLDTQTLTSTTTSAFSTAAASAPNQTGNNTPVPVIDITSSPPPPIRQMSMPATLPHFSANTVVHALEPLSSAASPLDLRATRSSSATATITSASEQTDPPTTSANSPTKNSLKFKFKLMRSKSKDNGVDESYQIVPCSKSEDADTRDRPGLLDNLPEPHQSVDEASGALSLIDMINNPPVASHTGPGYQGYWTCPNCAKFNLYFENPCDCGTAKA